MASIHDVAAYILARQGPMTTMGLQKLCYYAYGYHLAWEGRKLFAEPFEAWANGPVSRPLYQQHRGLYGISPGDLNGDPGKLDAGESESIDLVLDGFGALTGHQLSTMTHREPPWLRARERSGAAPLDRCSEQLDDAEIYEFFDPVSVAEPHQTHHPPEEPHVLGDGPMSLHYVRAEMTFTSDNPSDTNEAFDEFLDQFEEALFALANKDPRLVDPGTAGSLRDRRVSVLMGVDATSEQDAAQYYSAAIRTALHAAECYTPEWPTFQPTQEPQPELMPA